MRELLAEVIGRAVIATLCAGATQRGLCCLGFEGSVLFVLLQKPPTNVKINVNVNVKAILVFAGNKTACQTPIGVHPRA